jgi:hypothetical protein
MKFICVCLLLLFCFLGQAIVAEAGASPNRSWQFDGWLGVNFPTGSEFAGTYPDRNSLYPVIGVSGWHVQPFLLPDRVRIGVSLSYFTVFRNQNADGSVTGVAVIPITAEIRYALPYRNFRTFTAVGFGYAYSRLTFNDRGFDTNALAFSLKGGCEFPVKTDILIFGMLHLTSVFQTLVFPEVGEQSNSQFNVSLIAGVGYKI